MGGAFTAAPALALVLLVALSVAATANVSRRPPRTDRISRNLARDCEFSWSLMVVVVSSLLFFFRWGIHARRRWTAAAGSGASTASQSSPAPAASAPPPPIPSNSL